MLSKKMTREEIREGMAFKLWELDGGTREYWDVDAKARKEYGYRALLMARWQHSQGVVIKVEGELPPNKYADICLVEENGITRSHYLHIDEMIAFKEAQQDMLKWHNDSLEPLIEG